MRFTKYQGLGNDFIVLDAPLPEPTAEEARALCDRHRGVGADGVLLVEPGERAPWRMRVRNADGSPSEMCGNGLRCVARHLARHHGFSAGPIETGAGPLQVEVNGAHIRVAMGAARSLGHLRLDAAGLEVEGHHVRLGNPHFVLFGRWSDALFRQLGPALSTHPAFPEGVNVSFASLAGPNHIELRVWERGAGPTLACGTGACATVAAAWWEHRCDPSAVRVDLPGGRLTIEGAAGALVMQGPAERVFEGEWDAAL
ncbi:MAG: diaminopimelate epimerase [Myxococcales bacterium]|nr:diaminopimelate epimerase [Myxococcales bacterium]